MRHAWVLVLVSACSSRTPLPSAPPDASGPEAGAGFGASACAACLLSACGAEEEACASDPRCARYLACVSACPVSATGDAEPGCEASCEGADAASAWRECRRQGPGFWCEACGLNRKEHWTLNQRCEGVEPPPIVDAGANCYDPVTPVELACRACRYKKCCTTIERCNADADCLAFRRCIGCGDGLDACVARFPRGVAAFAPDFTCALQRCTEECTGGAVDPCVGCVNTRCGDERAAYDSTEAGFLHSLCVGRCEPFTLECQEACTRQYESIRGVFDAYTTCELARCAQACLD
jgi:hypothetical protein